MDIDAEREMGEGFVGKKTKSVRYFQNQLKTETVVRQRLCAPGCILS
jgi:hypothetical protein